MLAASVYSFAASQTQASVAPPDTGAIQRDVEVVNVYEPTLRHARKLNIEPTFDDTMSYKPVFKYETLRREAAVTTPLEKLKAAPMTFPQYKSPYNWLVEAAAGSQPGFMGQIAFNNKPNEHHLVTFRVGHVGMLGKVKLHDDNKVSAPEHSTWAQFDYAWTRNNFRFSTNLNFHNEAYRYYGYTPLRNLTDTLLLPDYNATALGSDANFANNADLLDERQRNTGFDLDFHFANAQAPRTGVFRFNAQAGMSFTGIRTGLHELRLRFGGNIYVPLRDQRMAIDADLAVVNFKDSKGDSDSLLYYFQDRKTLDFKVAPHFVMTTDIMRLRLGLKLMGVFYGDNLSQEFIIQPDLNLDFFLGDGRLRLNAEIGGDFQRNSYTDLAKQNRYLSPDQRVYLWDYSRPCKMQLWPWALIEPTRYPLLCRIGLRSRFSQTVQFHFGFEWASLEMFNCFVNRYAHLATQHEADNFRNPDKATPNEPQADAEEELPEKFVQLPQFALLQANGKRVRLHGELAVHPTERSTILLEGSWFHYKMSGNHEAYGAPFGNVKLSGRFAPIERLQCRASLEYHARSWSYDYHSLEEYKMKGFVDLNIGAAFYLSAKWSLFLDLNNLTCADQQRWQGYSSKRLNAFAGMTLKF